MSEIAATATDRDAVVHTVRLEATNHDGSFLGKSLAPKKFAAGAASGFAFADLLFGLDLGNAPTFGFAYPDWRGHLADLQFRPDMSTLVQWEPGLQSVIGDYWQADGTPVGTCPRNLARKLVDRLATRGFTATVAVEIEATLFEESIHEARAKGYRDLTPLGGSAGTRITWRSRRTGSTTCRRSPVASARSASSGRRGATRMRPARSNST